MRRDTFDRWIEGFLSKVPQWRIRQIMWSAFVCFLLLMGGLFSLAFVPLEFRVSSHSESVWEGGNNSIVIELPLKEKWKPLLREGMEARVVRFPRSSFRVMKIDTAILVQGDLDHEERREILDQQKPLEVKIIYKKESLLKTLFSKSQPI